MKTENYAGRVLGDRTIADKAPIVLSENENLSNCNITEESPKGKLLSKEVVVPLKGIHSLVRSHIYELLLLRFLECVK